MAATDYSIKGGHSYIKADGTVKLFFAAGATGSPVDVAIYDSSNDSWTWQNRSFTAGSTIEFATFVDHVFAVNINDATESYDGSSWSTSTNVTGAPKAKFVTPYLDRLYTAYIDDGSTYYSRVAYSDLPDNAGNLTWDTSTDYFDVSRDDGDIIKGLGTNANRLLIFKEDSLYRYDLSQLSKVPASPGTISQRTVKNLHGYTLYLHRTGVWRNSGSGASKLVSRSISDYINGIQANQIDKSCAWTKGDKYFLYIGSVSNSRTGLSIDNALIVYDIAQDNITVDSLAHAPLVAATHIDDETDVTYSDTRYTYSDDDINYSGYPSAEPVVYFGTDEGYIYQWDDGYTHAGTAINMEIETKWYYPGNPSSDKRFNSVLVYTEYGSSTAASYKVGGGQWRMLGQLYEPVTKFRFSPNTRGKKIKFKFTESSENELPEIQGFDVYYEPLPLVN